MQLLRMHLKDEAYDLIKDLTLTNNDFTVLDKTKTSLRNQKSNFSSVSTETDHTTTSEEWFKWQNHLKKLLDTTDQILATLKNLDRSVESCIIITICHKLNILEKNEKNELDIQKHFQLGQNWNNSLKRNTE